MLSKATKSHMNSCKVDYKRLFYRFCFFLSLSSPRTLTFRFKAFTSSFSTSILTSNLLHLKYFQGVLKTQKRSKLFAMQSPQCCRCCRFDFPVSRSVDQSIKQEDLCKKKTKRTNTQLQRSTRPPLLINQTASARTHQRTHASARLQYQKPN